MRKHWFALAFACAFTVTIDAQYDDSISVNTEEVTTQENSDFSIIRSNPRVDVREVPTSETERLKASDEYWYASLEREKPKPKTQQKPTTGKPWFGNLLWIFILVTFITVVGWYLASSNILLFRRGGKRIAKEEGEEATDNIFALPYDREIAKAETANDYRQAVRLRYLQTLRDLSDRNLISYQYGKTNSEYVNQMFRHPQSKLFANLTRNFEFVWYGQFPLSKERYGQLRNDFNHLKSALR